MALIGAALAMTLAYLLPNHSPPWMFFVQEGAAALALGLLALTVLMHLRGRLEWRLPDLLVLGLAALPWLQHAFGLVPFVQTAVLHSLYLLGLAVALLTGAALERRQPGQVATALLWSVWIAATVSVALQFYQWLFLGAADPALWVMRLIGSRPAANIGQPNVLASVIVLALLATYRFWRVRQLAAPLALASACWLVLGLAMTQSRTGLLNAVLLGATLVAWDWRGGNRRFAVMAVALLTLLLIVFTCFPLAVEHLTPHDAGQILSDRSTVGKRPSAWRLFIDSAWQQPVWGYGWGQTFRAQVDGALSHPALPAVFLAAHNLPLDLILWNGMPIGALLLALIALWIFRCVRRIRDDATLVLALFIGVLLVHAMLEYPLHYAFFLLPAGLAAGALHQRVGFKSFWQAPAWSGTLLVMGAAAGLVVTARDYLAVEQSYRDLLFEKARIRSDVEVRLPDVLVLDSLRSLITFSRLVPRQGMTGAELDAMRDVLLAHPGAAGFTKLASALALNGRADEAQRWVDIECRIFPVRTCEAMAAEWAEAALTHAEMRAIVWPQRKE